MPDLIDQPMADESEATETADQERMEAAEATRIRRFEDDHRRPDAVKKVIEDLEGDREYVHTDANLPTTAGGVSTNYLLRYQWIHSSQIYAKDPAVAVRPRKKLGQLVPAMSQLLGDFGKTVEYIVQHCANEGELRPIVDGMIQDADTCGIVFLKVNWIEDLGKDPIGTFRPNDLVTQVRRLQFLQGEAADGKIQEDAPERQEMQELAACIQKAMESERWRQMAYPEQRQIIGPDGLPQIVDGQPALEAISYPEGEDPRKLRWNGLPTPPQMEELPRYRGFVFDVFDADDVCWDWKITRPELLHRGAHLSTRVWMTADAIAQEYQLPSGEERAEYLSASGATGDASANQSAEKRNEAKPADTNADQRGGLLAVWERQSEDGYVYTWVQGAKKFLRKVKRDVVTSSRFNVFALYFNRASGRVMPVSNVTLGRPLQDEINTVRTHKRQAKRAAYNRYIAQQDLFDPDEQRRMESCPPEGVIFVKKNIEDIRKGLMPINGQYNAAVHDVSEEKQELSVAMNIPVSATGQTQGGSDTATEAAIANQSSDAMAGRHRSILESFLQRIFTYMSEVLIQALPEENAKAIAGPGAVWPMQDREALWNHLEVDIEAGSTGKPDQKKNMDALQQAMQIGQLMGIGQNPTMPNWNALPVMRKLADYLDWRDDPEDLLQMPALPPMPGPFMPGAGAGPGGPGPSQGDPSLPMPPGPPQMPSEPPPPAPQMTNPNHMAGAVPPGVPQ